MELLHENSQRPQQVDYICKKDPTANVLLNSSVTEGSKDTAYVWARDEPERIIYW